MAAWNILEDEFLDEGFLIDQGLTKIIAWLFCRSLEDTMKFTTHLKCKLTELQKFNINLLLENSTGNILLFNIVRNKLYDDFLKEICRKTNDNYLSINIILDNATSIYELLNPTEQTYKVTPALNRKAPTSVKGTFRFVGRFF